MTGRFALVMLVLIASGVAQAALTPSQLEAVIQAVHENDDSVLNRLTLEDASYDSEVPKLIRVGGRRLEIDRPGRYEIQGYDEVVINKKLKIESLQTPTCPSGYKVRCSLH